MKTTANPEQPPALQILREKSTPQSRLRIAHRLPPKPVRFSAITNKTVQDPVNWDAAWFASYE